jgi:hypothetical protein
MKNFGDTVIWRLGPPIAEQGHHKNNRRRPSELQHVMYWRPQDPEDESADLAANLCWKEMSKEKGVVADQ